MGLFGSGGIPDLRALRSKAEEAYLKQKWKKSLELYAELYGLISFDPKITQRLGDLHKKLGNEKEAIPYYKKTAQYYSKEGYWAKALAVGKILSEIDPSDQSFQEHMAKQVSMETQPRLEVSEQIIDLKDQDAIELEPQASTLGKPYGTLDTIPLFGELQAQEVAQILAKLEVRKFSPETFICLEGEMGESMFIVSEGIVEVQTKDEQNKKIILAGLKGGDFFGEYSMVTQLPRNASVVSKTEVELLEISRKDFILISKEYPKIWVTLEAYLLERFMDTLCQKSSVFSALSPLERKMLSKKVKVKKIESQDVVMEEGSEGSEMFFVKSGQFEIFSTDQGHKIGLGEVGVGGHFGEIAMLTGKQRTATVKAKTAGELLCLTKDDARETFKENAMFMDKLSMHLRARQKERRETLEAYKEAKISLAIV